MQSNSISQACALIKSDEVVGIPTETVYGLAANAFSEKALRKIFSVKGRPSSDPLILHLPKSWKSVSKLVEKNLVDLSLFSEIGIKTITTLINAFWPGPLTIILPKTSVVPDIATSNLNTVALRIPNHPMTQELLEALQLPLAAPSANRFGRISPTKAQHVTEELGNQVNLVLDGGPCAVGVESTVVRIHADGAVCLLRPGGVSKEALEEILQNQVLLQNKSSPQKAFESPGLLLNHYAPTKPLYLVSATGTVDDTLSAIQATQDSANCIAVLWASEKNRAEKEMQLKRSLGVEILSWVLSAAGEPEESAKNLFESLRQMDQSKAKILFAEKPNLTQGLALAIEDRLFKASTKS